MREEMADYDHRRNLSKTSTPTTRRYYSHPPLKRKSQCLRLDTLKNGDLTLIKKTNRDNSDLPDRLRYDPMLYLERPETSKALEEAIGRLPKQNRATVLTVDGTRLAGKTWFAMHLMCNHGDTKSLSNISLENRIYLSLEADGVEQRPDCCQQRCFYLHPSKETENASHSEEKENSKLLMRNLLVDIYRHLNISLPEDSSLWDIESWIGELPPESWKSKRGTRILFVDGIAEASNVEISLFESYFLKYILQQPGFVIALLGKPKGIGWFDPDLRKDDDLQRLKAFNYEETEQQIERMIRNDIHVEIDLNSLPMLQEYSAGVPGSSSYLAREGVSLV